MTKTDAVPVNLYFSLLLWSFTAILCSNETLFFSWLVYHLPVIINHIYCLRTLNMVLIFEVTQKGTVERYNWLIFVGGICSSRFYLIWFSESKCSCKDLFVLKGDVSLTQFISIRVSLSCTCMLLFYIQWQVVCCLIKDPTTACPSRTSASMDEWVMVSA